MSFDKVGEADHPTESCSIPCVNMLMATTMLETSGSSRHSIILEHWKE